MCFEKDNNNVFYYCFLFSTRFPNPHKKGAGATDLKGCCDNRKTLLTVSLKVSLLSFAAWQEGGVPMTVSIAIEFAVYFAFKIGNRVENRIYY